MAVVSKADIARQLLGSSLKVEYVELTSVSDNDTFVSKLQNPFSALAFPMADNGAANNLHATVSSRTVTVREPGSVTAVAVLVFGQ